MLNIGRKKILKIKGENVGSTPIKGIESAAVIQFDGLSRANLKNIIAGSMTTADDLRQLEVPADYFIMNPWLKPGSLTLVYGAAGVGKTFFCMSVAVAVTQKLQIGRWGSGESGRLPLP